MKDSSQKAVTIQDVANAVGVTKATVSKVFNDKGRISSTTAEAVRQAAHRLNFQPNPHARSLSNGGSPNTIALFFLHLDLGVSVRKLQTIQGLLAHEGYEVPAYTFSPTLHPRIKSHAACMMNSLRRQKPRAIICTPSEMGKAALDELQRYHQEGGIVVCYDTPTKLDCDKVVLDRKNSTYLATKHLLELGHREIAFSQPGVLQPHSDYLKGFKKALKEFGLAANENWIFGSDGPGLGGGLYEAAGAQLAEKFLRLRRRPSAICICDDYAAIAFSAAISEAGVSVPEDVSVVGLDDSPIARYGVLKLTTVTHPTHIIAGKVVDLVLDRVENRYSGAPREVLVCGELITRQSTTEFKIGMQSGGGKRNNFRIARVEAGSTQSNLK